MNTEITEAKGTTILWDFAIQADRKIKKNQLVVEDYKSKTFLLIQQVTTYEYNKYKYLEIEI